MLDAAPDDRFSNHAPFHFDLSVLDLYVPFSVGGSVHIVPEQIAYLPTELCRFLVAEGITVWYSVPSALMMMLDHGDLGEVSKDSQVRAFMFAGEPFPLPHLRMLKGMFPASRLLNLYGPTETNVCTYYEVTDIPEGREAPMPIGGACSENRVWAVDAAGDETVIGGEGELLVDGPTVMRGYWGKPRHRGPYATGDVVRRLATDSYEYVGRRDQMVKVRGHRGELGEIEAALTSHEEVRECAVVVSGEGTRAKLIAFLSATGDKRPGILALKRHCAERLPRYMIVDKAVGIEALPRTGNGKVDRERLRAMLVEPAGGTDTTSGQSRG